MSALRTLQRMLRVTTRSVERDAGYVIVPYRGYGSRREVYLMGRVFHQPTGAKDGSSNGLMAQIGRRLLRSGEPDVELDVHFQGSSSRVVTDKDGYFTAHMILEAEPPSDRLWHEAEVVLAEPVAEDDVARGRADAQIYIPPDSARYLVISDIDDTVMFTGVANKIRMFWRLFAQDAESRLAFPGVAALYDAFFAGASGNDQNPILYVSRGHWGLYEMLDEFFRAHEIPVGPILFLRDWGVSLRSPLPRRAEDHKADLIRDMASLYDELPLVLIGDSGQHDPEIYADVVRRNKDRVKAVYIRNVSRSEARAGEIDRLAAEVKDAGSSMILADDTFAMARHAAEHGLIAEEALSRILEERVREAKSTPDRTTGPVVVE